MRAVFLGSDRWSVPALRRLTSEIDVGLVVTRAPRPAGRGSNLRRTEVALAASELGLELLEVERIGVDASIELLGSSIPDAIAVVAYGEILPAPLLRLAPCINLHFSLLPRWRGAAPVQRAIMAGDDVTGVTTMLMDEGLDTGAVIRQEPVPIEPRTTLLDRIHSVEHRILPEVVRELCAAR